MAAGSQSLCYVRFIAFGQPSSFSTHLTILSTNTTCTKVRPFALYVDGYTSNFAAALWWEVDSLLPWKFIKSTWTGKKMYIGKEIIICSERSAIDLYYCEGNGNKCESHSWATTSASLLINLMHSPGEPLGKKETLQNAIEKALVNFSANQAPGIYV